MKWPLSRPSLWPYLRYEQRPAPDDDGLRVHFLGVSTLLLSDGETSVLTDGFVTRPGLLRVLFGRIAPSRALIRAAIDRLGVTNLAAIVCVHSHYDHALDAPVWAHETGADLVGSESTANIGRGVGVETLVVRDADTIRYGSFEFTFLNSVHSPGDLVCGTVDRPLVPPAHVTAWKTGTTYSVIITHPRGRMLLQASANYRTDALRDQPVDVIYLGVGMLGKRPPEFVRAYWDEVVGATSPKRIILVHWDDFFTGLDRPLRPMRYLVDDLETTMSRLEMLARRDEIDIVLPVPWLRTDPFAGLA